MIALKCHEATMATQEINEMSGKPEIRKTNYAEREIASWDEEIDWDKIHKSMLAAEKSAAKYQAQRPEE